MNKMFKKIGLTIILVGLLSVGAGCGSGGGSSVSTPTPTVTATSTPTSTPVPAVKARVVGSYPINLSYRVTTSSSDIVEMNVASIDVNDDCSLKVHCTWTVIISNSERVVKLSDKDTKTFCIVDSNNKSYDHTNGDGAAYAKTILSTTPVTGSYDFPALESGVSSIYFYDSVYNQKTGLILVYNSN
jgi:hypothetical protein